MEKDAASQSELRAHIQIQLSLKSLSTLIRVENNRTMSEYNYSTSDPDEESQDLDLRIEETATEISGMETGPSQSPVRNQRSKKKKRIIRPMSPASEAESESILTTVSFLEMYFILIVILLYVGICTKLKNSVLAMYHRFINLNIEYNICQSNKKTKKCDISM